MKRFLITILMICLLASLAACGSNNNTDTNKEIPSTEESIKSQPETSSDQQDDVKNDDGIDLMYTFKDPSKPVAFDYPNMKCIEETTSRVFKTSKYIIVYCRDSKKSELGNIPTELIEDFKSATSTHLEGTFDSFSLTNTEEKTINQTDTLLVKGYVVSKYDDGSTINLPMRGYTFAKGDVVCELIAVLNEETNDANQEEMEKTIDAIIETLRDDR